MPYASPCAPPAPPHPQHQQTGGHPLDHHSSENQEERLADDCLSTVAGPQPFALRRPWPKLAPVFIQRERILWANASVYRIISEERSRPPRLQTSERMEALWRFSKFGRHLETPGAHGSPEGHFAWGQGAIWVTHHYN